MEVCREPTVRKIVEAEEALDKIRDGSVVAISGFNMSVAPIYILERLFKLYLKTGHPRDLFVMSDAFPGAPGKGLDMIARIMYERGDTGFIRGVLLPYLGWSPWLQKLVAENRIEAYTWTIGVMAYWFREVGSGRPGVLTKVGIGTFEDPRDMGGALNELSREKMTARVELLEINGEEYLLYTAPKPEVALIRGSTADEKGNLTMEDEAVYGTVLNIAQAAKAMPRKGLVIAQVLRIARFGSLNPKHVVVPGPLVDHVVVAPPEKHPQTDTIQYDPRISGHIIPPLDKSMVGLMELGPRKVVARRILMALAEIIKREGRPIIVNLGVGIPSQVAQVAVEEDMLDLIEITIESGPWGGIALHGPDFGASLGPYAIISMPDQFTIYEGGIIDAASLGFLQVDQEGNVNASMLPGRIPGPGGFSVIAYGAPRLLFGGHFTAGKQSIKVDPREGKLVIERDGPVTKFVERVYKVFFNSRQALEQGKEVLYITERAVFKLTPQGLELSEVAPGVNVERDILSKMEFQPIVKEPKTMDPRLFRERPMNLKTEILQHLRV